MGSYDQPVLVNVRRTVLLTSMTRYTLIADRAFYLVLLETDLARTSTANAPSPSPKTLHAVTVHRRFIGNKYLGRE